MRSNKVSLIMFLCCQDEDLDHYLNEDHVV
jgi:hypothetical protein